MSSIGELLDQRKFKEAYDLLVSERKEDNEDWNRSMIVCCYYVDKHDEARRAMDRIMFRNRWNRDICVANMCWYTTDIRKHATLVNFSNEALSIISEETCGELRKTYFPSNPSIYKHKDGFVANIRFVTYYVLENQYLHTTSDNTINTENALVFYDNNMVELRRVRITDTRNRYYTMIKGIEDLRICHYDGKYVTFIATVVDYQPEFYRVMPRMVSGKINVETGLIEEYFMPQIKFEGRCEKNWVPLLGSDEFVYQFGSHDIELVVPSKDKFESRTVSQTLNLDNLRGSTQVVPYKEGYITVVHEVYQLSNEQKDRRRYIHRFVELDSNLLALRCSSPFKYSDEGIQYIAGLCYDDNNDRFIFSGSVNDRDARMYSITSSTLEKLINHEI